MKTIKFLAFIGANVTVAGTVTVLLSSLSAYPAENYYEYGQTGFYIALSGAVLTISCLAIHFYKKYIAQG